MSSPCLQLTIGALLALLVYTYVGYPVAIRVSARASGGARPSPRPPGPTSGPPR